MKLINPSDKIFVAGHRGMVGNAVYNLLSTESGKSFIEYREDHTPKPFASDELKMLREEFQKVSNKLTTEQLL